jgi:hypothetical protein
MHDHAYYALESDRLVGHPGNVSLTGFLQVATDCRMDL